jgi:hypothetical protein
VHGLPRCGRKKKQGPSFNDISVKSKMGLGCAKGDAEAMLNEGILGADRLMQGRSRSCFYSI